MRVIRLDEEQPLTAVERREQARLLRRLSVFPLGLAAVFGFVAGVAWSLDDANMVFLALVAAGCLTAVGAILLADAFYTEE